jgi:hypothetical protein
LHQIGKGIKRLGAGFTNEFEHLAQIHRLTGFVPPFLFAFVAREKLDLTPIGKAVLDLDYVVDAALGTIHCREMLPKLRASYGSVVRGCRFEAGGSRFEV